MDRFSIKRDIISIKVIENTKNTLQISPMRKIQLRKADKELEVQSKTSYVMKIFLNLF